MAVYTGMRAALHPAAVDGTAQCRLAILFDAHADRLYRLARRLTTQGAQVLPLNCHPGSEPLDHHIDVPPYAWLPHLRLMLGRYATTSHQPQVR